MKQSIGSILPESYSAKHPNSDRTARMLALVVIFIIMAAAYYFLH